jgi:peroxiredoxin Q/BCP
MLAAGTEAPDFTVDDHDGKPTTLSEQRGTWVLLWWYPKADTPGCTMEGQGLRDQARSYADAGCTVLGISFDTPADNAAFREKFDFPFSLLCDVDQSVGTLYEVQRDPGDPYAGIPKRISYLIDPEGRIVKAYEVSDPAGHAAEVLADLGAAQR